MDTEVTEIRSPEDFEDSRARNILLEQNLEVGELPNLKQKLYERGDFMISPLTARNDPSLIRELFAAAILYFELTKKNSIVIPDNKLEYTISFEGRDLYKIYGDSSWYLLQRERSIESYERTAKSFLKNAKRLERCSKHRYLGPILWRL
jgi:hypothetical protein